MKKFLYAIFLVLVGFALVACTNQVKVTFNPDNGSATMIVWVEKGDQVNPPATDPIKEGFTFQFWALVGTVTKVDFPVVIEAATTFIAIWEPVVVVDNTLANAKASLQVGYGGTDTATSVTENVLLVDAIGEVNIVWVSSKPGVVSTSGVVVRPANGEGNANVVLNATLTYKGATDMKVFNLVVLEEDPLPDYSPVVTPKLWHWMPAAVGATCKYDVETFGANDDSFDLSYAGTPLLREVDFDFEDDELVIYGSILVTICGVNLGTFVFDLETDFGTTTLEVIVVDDPVGTSIPTKVVQGIDMRGVTQAEITSPVAGPALLITGILGGSRNDCFDYIEVFNNTSSPYNLINHKIVLSGVNYNPLQTTYGTNGVMSNPIGQTFHYIYDNFILDPFETGLIWMINVRTWAPGTLTSGSYNNDVAEDSAFAARVSLNDFRAEYGIDPNVKVYKSYQLYAIVNQTSAYDTVNFIGAAPSKASVWVLGSTADRAIQIQKLDTETYFSNFSGTEATTAVSAKTCAFFRYEPIMFNRDKDVYETGSLDHTKIKVYAGRAQINIFGIRVRYFDSAKNDLGFSDNASLGYANGALDIYNIANVGTTGASAAVAYDKLHLNAMTSIVQAFMYTAINGSSSIKWADKYGSPVELDYTLPLLDMSIANSGKTMRFIPKEDSSPLLTWLNGQTTTSAVQKHAIAPAVPFLSATKNIVVPVSAAYPTTYLKYATTTAGISGWYNLGLTV